MEAPDPVGTALPRWLRRAWLVGAALLAVGTVLPGSVLLVPGLVVLGAAAGVTAARRDTPRGWHATALAVPAAPPVVGAAVIGWAWLVGADPMVIGLVVWVGVPVAVALWTVFVAAAAVELVRGRRRRFGAAGPAWENDASPPSYH